MINVQVSFNYNVNKSSQNIVKFPYHSSTGEHAKVSFKYSCIPLLEKPLEMNYNVNMNLLMSNLTFHYSIEGTNPTSKIIVRKQDGN